MGSKMLLTPVGYYKKLSLYVLLSLSSLNFSSFALVSLDNSVSHFSYDQLNGSDCVIVAWDYII